MWLCAASYLSVLAGSPLFCAGAAREAAPVTAATPQPSDAAALGTGAYDLAFADPPYESRMLDRVIDHWRATAFAPVLAVEHARTHPLPPGAVTQVFGDTAVTIYRAPRPVSD